MTDDPVRVELVVDADCPHARAARSALAEALAEVGRPREWIERVQPPASDSSADDPSRLPSPTVLVDGVDAVAPATGAGCRIYRDSTGARIDAPPVEALVRALRRLDRDAGGASS